MTAKKKRPTETWTTKDICGGDVLTLKKLKTCEDGEDQEELGKLLNADEHAADIIIGGALLPADAGPVRLSEAIGDVSGIERCECRYCEEGNYDAMKREQAAYYVGMAVGLRLAQVTTMRDAAVRRQDIVRRAGLNLGGAR